ncbi:hypothetical protein [Kineococcus aurantiacus]|uniref:Putative alkaline shock family protein YloU n=1 Tax=Kineococcus aurantiacus TaxID=37633 RepID=A0A7Y9AS72_9ACTN|nr:hypothetical protein [Kineococcus aurantiacus]NYD20514.1 putative alkaline shock family protein YloU [Kineococcus aurantiacus]
MSQLTDEQGPARTPTGNPSGARTAGVADIGDVADEVAARVVTVPGVEGLHPGRFGEVATYLPGRRVQGLRLDGQRLEVHVVLRFGVDIATTAQRIRAAVAPVVTAPVDVFVEDLTTPTAQTAPAPPA